LILRNSIQTYLGLIAKPHWTKNPHLCDKKRVVGVGHLSISVVAIHTGFGADSPNPIFILLSYGIFFETQN
jgi:hypothetical protein